MVVRALFRGLSAKDNKSCPPLSRPHLRPPNLPYAVLPRERELRRLPQGIADIIRLGFHPHLQLQDQRPNRGSASKAEEAQYEHETREESVERTMQSMMLNGTPGPQTRYLLRIVEEDPHGPGGMMSGKGVDFVHDKARQHPQTPEKSSTKIRLQDVLEKSKYKDKPFAYEAERPSKAQKDTMKWSEKRASNRDERGLGNATERAWTKGQVNKRLGELAGKVQGFT
ncbi:hypothetical protein OEA41_008387 [Lepraria neglecta]|uniref:Uncharacterized protein n=1 Tax=Lepraria neglecta TaxID=209136 RepID=A0AAE0DQY8_9LECA|nr:hypothetical protein OEA41_008387 [Lepraria neglecta]